MDGNILVDGATTNNSSTINSSLVVAIGLDVEILEFLDVNGKRMISVWWRMIPIVVTVL